MIIELIGTWLLVGFVSAVGWNIAEETVNKPYIDPYIAKKNGKNKGGRFNASKKFARRFRQINKFIKERNT